MPVQHTKYQQFNQYMLLCKMKRNTYCFPILIRIEILSLHIDNLFICVCVYIYNMYIHTYVKCTRGHEFIHIYIVIYTHMHVHTIIYIYVCVSIKWRGHVTTLLYIKSSNKWVNHKQLLTYLLNAWQWEVIGFGTCILKIIQNVYTHQLHYLTH